MDTGTKDRGQAPSRLRREEGASMVEFALVAPLLFILLFGIIEFGLLLYNQAVITNASREGARYAVMYYIDPSNNTAQQHLCSDVQNFVQNSVAPYLVSFANPAPLPQVTCPLQDQNEAGVGNVWQVQVTYRHTFLVFGSLITLLNGSISNPLTLTAKTVMRDENQ